ncbi:hypothetical protein [Candidatus Cardinium hertigii]|uniref:hypothetical protein n=1 Tax=Candidatus Cardinium hertigii TaxID=247481 RepID=UPI00194FB264|nr:hypothetical protein [Candidatus Cardinium hertigii]
MGAHNCSPQSKFRAIIEKHGKNRSRRIEKFRELGVAFLDHKDIENNEVAASFCDEKIKLGMHLISVGGEFLHVANYEEVMQIFNNYLMKLPLKK